jgi:hypothetical protein
VLRTCQTVLHILINSNLLRMVHDQSRKVKRLWGTAFYKYSCLLTANIDSVYSLKQVQYDDEASDYNSRDVSQKARLEHPRVSLQPSRAQRSESSMALHTLGIINAVASTSLIASSRAS